MDRSIANNSGSDNLGSSKIKKTYQNRKSISRLSSSKSIKRSKFIEVVIEKRTTTPTKKSCSRSASSSGPNCPPLSYSAPSMSTVDKVTHSKDSSNSNKPSTLQDFWNSVDAQRTTKAQTTTSTLTTSSSNTKTPFFWSLPSCSPSTTKRGRPKNITLKTSSSNIRKGKHNGGAAKKQGQQTYLLLGQKNFSSVNCQECGMSYACGTQQDEELHSKYHKAVVNGIILTSYRSEVLINSFNDDLQQITRQARRRKNGSLLSYDVESCKVETPNLNGSIVTYSWHRIGAFERKKMQEICAIMNHELGSAEIPEGRVSNSKIYIYLSDKRKVMGCVVAESIIKAYRVTQSPTNNSSNTDNITVENKNEGMNDSNQAMPTLKGEDITTDQMNPRTTCKPIKSRKRKADQSETNVRQSGSIVLSKASEIAPKDQCYALDHLSYESNQPIQATIGINRMWVIRSLRRRGIATRLLDAVRTTFIRGYQPHRSLIAFSQPTYNGIAFAAHYTNSNCFLVYSDGDLSPNPS